ncbi:hypothetical protein Tco_1127878 [Tanacetum coccineum]
MLRLLLLLLRITIYGSDLLILSAYAPSMSSLLSLPLSTACDYSDGCVTMVIASKALKQANRLKLSRILAGQHENVFAAMAAGSLFYLGFMRTMNMVGPFFAFKAAILPFNITVLLLVVISLNDLDKVTLSICIVAGRAMMNLKGYEKGEIIHSLAWQRTAFAAMAGASSVFGRLPT